MTTKTCTKCGEIKTLDNFHKQSKGKYGVRGYCKVCALEIRKLDHFNNRDRNNKQRADAYRKQCPFVWVRDIYNNHVKDYKKYKAKVYLKEYSKIYRNNNNSRSKISSENLDDNYIKSLLTNNSNLNVKDIPNELIKLKQIHAKLNRKIKEMTK